MKNCFLILALATAMFGCTSKTSKVDEQSKSEVGGGVVNVNGNIPDTTNSINLSTQKKDSAVDTLHK